MGYGDTLMIDRLFTYSWASEVADILYDDVAFRAQAKWLAGNVRMVSGARCILFRFEDGDINVLGTDMSAPFLFGIRGDDSAWRELLTGPHASLNRCVREGQLVLEGDRVALMRSWKVVFILTETCRRVSRSSAQVLNSAAGSRQCPT